MYILAGALRLIIRENYVFGGSIIIRLTIALVHGYTVRVENLFSVLPH